MSVPPKYLSGLTAGARAIGRGMMHAREGVTAEIGSLMRRYNAIAPYAREAATQASHACRNATNRILGASWQLAQATGQTCGSLATSMRRADGIIAEGIAHAGTFAAGAARHTGKVAAAALEHGKPAVRAIGIGIAHAAGTVSRSAMRAGGVVAKDAVHVGGLLASGVAHSSTALAKATAGAGTALLQRAPDGLARTQAAAHAGYGVPRSVALYGKNGITAGRYATAAAIGGAAIVGIAAGAAMAGEGEKRRQSWAREIEAERLAGEGRRR